jgi:hypothetical protein
MLDLPVDNATIEVRPGGLFHTCALFTKAGICTRGDDYAWSVWYPGLRHVKWCTILWSGGYDGIMQQNTNEVAVSIIRSYISAAVGPPIFEVSHQSYGHGLYFGRLVQLKILDAFCKGWQKDWTLGKAWFNLWTKLYWLSSQQNLRKLYGS